MVCHTPSRPVAFRAPIVGRPRKGARLYLRAGRIDTRTGRQVAAIYFIRDGDVSISTGCGADRLEDAEAQLAAYLAAKRETSARERRAAQDPEDVLIADVVRLYALEKAPAAADPKAVAARLDAILNWWAGKTLGDIRRSTCSAYVAHRCAQPIKSFKDPSKARKVTAAGARRELEDLSAAAGYWRAEHPLTRDVIFTYPDKPSESPRDALSRSDAAALLLAAMGWRKQPDGRWRRLGRSAVANRKHLRRFVILGLYSGSRPGVLPKLRWGPSDDAAWIDLEKGWIYRRGRMEVDQPTKRRPQIRIPKRLMAHLKRWQAMDASLPVRSGKKDGPSPPTVLHRGGKAIKGKIRKGYASLVADAGLDPRVTPHWHRHTAATWLMEANVPLQRAAQYLGMSVQTLEKHYGHHRPDYQSDVGAAISKGGRKAP